MPKKQRRKSGCSVAECTGEHMAKGLCQKHYGEKQRRKAGATERGALKPWKLEFKVSTDLYERFQRKVPRRQRSDVLRRALEAELLKIDEEGVGP